MTTPPLQHLFHSDNTGAYLDAVRSGAETVAAHLDRAGRPATGRTALDAAAEVSAVDLDAPLGDSAAALAELSTLWLEDTVWFHEPTYAAHLNCPVAIPAILAEVLSRGQRLPRHLGPERRRHLHRAAPRSTGPPGGSRPGVAGADGIFTSGGTQSNLQALLLARDHALATGGAAAPAAHPGLRSRRTSASEGGAAARPGTDAVVPGGRDRRATRMDPVALARVLARTAAEGDVPMAVVATAGTTDFGALDPLPEVAALARAVRRLVPRRRGVRRRAARLPHPAAPAGRHRARRLGDRGLPQDVVPAGLGQRARRARRGHPAPRHLARRLPQPPGRRPPQPGGQVHADHPALRRAQALDDPAHHGRRRHRRLVRPRHRPRRPGGRGAGRNADFEVAAAPQLSTVVFRYRPAGLEDGRAGPSSTPDRGPALLRRARRWSRPPRSRAAPSSSSRCSTRWPRRGHPRRRRPGPRAPARTWSAPDPSARAGVLTRLAGRDLHLVEAGR